MLFIETPIFTKHAGSDFFLLAYPKNKQENSTKAVVKLLRELIED
jgi:hypothetical protein